MNNEKIGKFIAECRKDKALTQIQLANKLGVSDRAVSKWGRGINMPDVSLFEPLCEELNISINDLISGERLNDNEYKTKAEENIIKLFSSQKNIFYFKVIARSLIICAIIILFLLPDTLNMTLKQNIVVRLIGVFIFGCGNFLEYYIQSTFYN
jgi:Predicted transcriptional regulators